MPPLSDANFENNRWANGRNFGNTGNVGFSGNTSYGTTNPKYEIKPFLR